MADFKTALNWMLDNEDARRAYKTVPDIGGQAISGINSASYPDHFDAIDAMPQADRGPAVDAFYQDEFWNEWLEKLDSDELAKRVFDAAVNMGPNTAVRILQKASRSPVDGHWGPQTVSVANAAGESLVEAFKTQRLTHYEGIVAARPSSSIYLGTEDHPGPWWTRAMK